MTNQNNEDEFMFQQFQKETKQKIFQMIKTYLQHTETINPILIYIVIFIQSLQILWFSIHPQLQFLNNPFLLNYFRSALSYVNLQSFLHSNNQLLLAFVIITSTLVIIFIVLVAVSVKITISYNYIRKPEYLNTLNKIVTYSFILFNTILTIPVYNVSIITLYCDKNSIYYNKTSNKCYDSTHIVMCIFAAINLFVILISSLIYWFLFYLRDPFNKGYYSLANNLFRLGKLVIKLLPPAYFLIDVEHSYQNIYVVVLLVLVFAYIAFFKINSIHNFYQNYFYCQFYMELIILWFFANTALCFQIKNSGMNFVQSLICSLLFAYVICVVESALWQKFLQKNLFENVKKQDRQKFIYILIGLLFKEISSTEISPAVYIKILNSNLNICSIKIFKFLHNIDLKNDEIITVIRQLLLYILNKYFQQETTVTLKLIKCCILFESGLKIVSLHQINKIRPDKLSLYEQFMIYHFKRTRNLFQQNQMRSNQDNLNQITTYLEFIEKMNQFQSQIQLCTKNNQQFWEQLCEDLPSINKIFNLSQLSIKYYNKIQEIFKKIELIYPENLPSLLIYFSFLDQVRANYRQFTKIREKLCVQKQRQLHKQSLQIEAKITKIKFKPNQQMCVVHVSTFSSNIGTILNCNSNVKNFLGYEKSDLISQKVTKIMPKIYAQIHDQFIKNYLLKADEMKLPTQKTVFPLKKNLMIVQTFLAIKIFPNIVNGFQLVGFFKQAQKKQNQITFMLNLKTLQIEGMTSGFVKLAGNRLKLQDLQKQSFKLSHVFPQIEPNHVFKMGQKISTMLRFSDCTDKLIDLEEASSQDRKKLEKNISLQLVTINYYSNCQIGIFSVSPLQQIKSLKDTNNLKNIQKNHLKHNFNNGSMKKRITHIEDQSQQQVYSIQRKIQDFLGSKLQLFSIRIIKIIFFLCFLAFCIASTVINVLNINENVQHTRLLQQINLANNITILQGKILTNNKLIVQKSNDQIQWNIVKHHYMQYLKQLQKTTTILFQKANQRKYQKLIINQFNLYQFNLISISRNQYSTTNLHYFDGILQIIFIGFDMLSKNISLFYLPLQQHISQSLYFIQQNIKQMLPMVGQKTIQSYSTYFYQKLSQELQNQIYFVIQKTTIYLVIYLILCFSIKKFSQFNKLIITIYNSILKWDAYQLFYKCHQFRINNFDNNQSNFDKNSRSYSNLFRLLPKNIFVKLTQPKIKDKIDQSYNNSKDNNIIQHHRQNNSSQISYYLQQKKKFQRKLQKIQQNQKKIDLINIKLQQSYIKRYALIFLLLLCLILINFASSFLRNDYNKQLLQQKDYSINLGKYSKSCLFTLYYSTQVIKGNTQYMRLYKQQLQYFYNRSNQIAIYLNNNQEYIRQVYKQIQILHSLVNDQISTINSTKKEKLITQAKQNIFKISDKLNIILTNNQQISLTSIYSFQRTMRIIKICLDIIITIIFCKLVLINLIKPAQNQLQYSFNMLKMLPTWLIIKNKNIRNIISLQNLDKQQMGKSKIGDQQSAASLMQQAGM